MTTSATAIKTIKIEYTTAPLIRCIARQDMPEADIKEGQCFYMARSSKSDGTYYLLTWEFDLMKWDCRCPSYKPCRHEKLVNADCKKPHTLFSYQPSTPCKGEEIVAPTVDKSATFKALYKKYDYRTQTPMNDLYSSQIEAIMKGQRVQVERGAFCLAR